MSGNTSKSATVDVQTPAQPNSEQPVAPGAKPLEKASGSGDINADINIKLHADAVHMNTPGSPKEGNEIASRTASELSPNGHISSKSFRLDTDPEQMKSGFLNQKGDKINFVDHQGKQYDVKEVNGEKRITPRELDTKKQAGGGDGADASASATAKPAVKPQANPATPEPAAEPAFKPEPTKSAKVTEASQALGADNSGGRQNSHLHHETPGAEDAKLLKTSAIVQQGAADALDKKVQAPKSLTTAADAPIVPDPRSASQRTPEQGQGAADAPEKKAAALKSLTPTADAPIVPDPKSASQRTPEQTQGATDAPDKKAAALKSLTPTADAPIVPEPRPAIQRTHEQGQGQGAADALDKKVQAPKSPAPAADTLAALDPRPSIQRNHEQGQGAADALDKKVQAPKSLASTADTPAALDPRPAIQRNHEQGQGAADALDKKVQAPKSLASTADAPAALDPKPASQRNHEQTQGAADALDKKVQAPKSLAPTADAPIVPDPRSAIQRNHEQTPGALAQASQLAFKGERADIRDRGDGETGGGRFHNQRQVLEGGSNEQGGTPRRATNLTESTDLSVKKNQVVPPADANAAQGGLISTRPGGLTPPSPGDHCDSGNKKGTVVTDQSTPPGANKPGIPAALPADTALPANLPRGSKPDGVEGHGPSSVDVLKPRNEVVQTAVVNPLTGAAQGPSGLQGRGHDSDRAVPPNANLPPDAAKTPGLKGEAVHNEQGAVSGGKDLGQGLDKQNIQAQLAQLAANRQTADGMPVQKPLDGKMGPGGQDKGALDGQTAVPVPPGKVVEGRPDLPQGKVPGGDDNCNQRVRDLVAGLRCGDVKIGDCHPGDPNQKGLLAGRDISGKDAGKNLQALVGKDPLTGKETLIPSGKDPLTGKDILLTKEALSAKDQLIIKDLNALMGGKLFGKLPDGTYQINESQLLAFRMIILGQKGLAGDLQGLNFKNQFETKVEVSKTLAQNTELGKGEVGIKNERGLADMHGLDGIKPAANVRIDPLINAANMAGIPNRLPTDGQRLEADKAAVHNPDQLSGKPEALAGKFDSLAARSEPLAARPEPLTGKPEPSLGNKLDSTVRVEPTIKTEAGGKVDSIRDARVSDRADNIISNTKVNDRADNITSNTRGEQSQFGLSQELSANPHLTAAENAHLKGDRLASNTGMTLEEELKERDKKKLEDDKLEDEKNQNARNAMLAALAAQKKQQELAEKEKQLLMEDAKKKGEDKRRRYVVKEKDTLESIAKKQLRDVRLAALIYDINKHMLPVRMEKGKQVVDPRPGTSIWLPSEVDIREFRSKLYAAPKQSGLFGQIPAKAQSQFASAEDELQEKFGSGWDGGTTPSGQVAAGMMGAAVAKSQVRRANIEKVLGPMAPKPTEVNRIRYIVRLSDTLEGVANKHPALKDPSLWPLVAILNNLPTDEDDDGKPIAALRRGMVLDIPTVQEISEYRESLVAPEAEEASDLEVAMSDSAMSRILSQSASDVVVAARLAEQQQKEQTRSGSFEAVSAPLPAVPQAPRSEPVDQDSTVVLNASQQAAVSESAGYVTPSPAIYENVPQQPAPVEPVAQAPLPSNNQVPPQLVQVQQVQPQGAMPPMPPPMQALPQNQAAAMAAAILAQPPIVAGDRLMWALDRNVRLVKSSIKWDPLIGVFRAQLEILLGGVWYPVIFYEAFERGAVRHEYSGAGKRKSVRIDLPPTAVQELADNDLVNNWSNYTQRFIAQVAGPQPQA